MVIIAALNEEAGIGPTLSELKGLLVDPFFLVVDGNSSDGTVEAARAYKAEIVMQNGEKGKGSALSQGLEHVRELDHEPDYIVLTDADYTYPAEYVPGMIQILQKDATVGMVIGNRFDKAFNYRSAIANSYYLGNRLLAHMHNVLNGVDLHDPLSGLRVIRWDLLRNWRPKSKSFDIEVELNYYVEKMGYRIREIPIRYRPRLGEKKLKLKHGFVIARRIISEA